MDCTASGEPLAEGESIPTWAETEHEIGRLMDNLMHRKMVMTVNGTSSTFIKVMGVRRFTKFKKILMKHKPGYYDNL
ncbi:MAG: hypothetical protein FWH06_00395 [Oscillospiraceae bacterium]|nr:hypothetical protein [Oscillospiraceae bacterium]